MSGAVLPSTLKGLNGRMNGWMAFTEMEMIRIWEGVKKTGLDVQLCVGGNKCNASEYWWRAEREAVLCKFAKNIQKQNGQRIYPGFFLARGEGGLIRWQQATSDSTSPNRACTSLLI